MDSSTKWKKIINQKVNYNYLKITKELPLLLRISLENYFKPETQSKERVLIIDTCLIGDFFASLPALVSFIKRTNLKVDLIVSPPLRKIAEHLIGIEKVFTAESLYDRNKKNKCKEEFIGKNYKTVILFRISQDAYKLIEKIDYSSMRTYLKPYLKYMAHLTKNVLLKREVKQWREVNFELIGIKKSSRKYSFTEIFNFKKSDYNRIKRYLGTDESKKVIIHTDTNWALKSWENKKWAKLLMKINNLGKFKFIFIGNGNAEKQSFKEIQKNLDFKIFSMIGRIDLMETLLLIKASDYFIGIDSGPRNIAHFIDTRSISLLGPGPKFFLPVNKEDIVIDKSDCRCTSFFCYKKESCIERIQVNEVFEAFKKLIKK